MKRFAARLMLAATALLLTAAMSVAFAQTTHEVHMLIQEEEGEFFPEFYFEPAGLYLEPGDTVRFIADTPHHTVTAVHEGHGFPTRVPEGVGPFSSPVLPIGDTWEYTFEEPGVYDLVCMPHFFFGMAMRLVVGEATGPGAAPVPEDVPAEATFMHVLSAPALLPENIMAVESVSWSEIGDEHKVLPPFMQNVEVPEGES